MNKQTQKYYQTIHHLFPILGKPEKRYLKYVKTHLEEYEMNHQQTQYQDYVDYFGHPQDIVSAYYEHIESEYIITHMKARKMIKYATFICLFVVISVGTYLFWTRYQIYQEYLNSRVEYEDTYIIEEPFN